MKIWANLTSYIKFIHTQNPETSLPTLEDIATVNNALKMIVSATSLEDKFFV